MDAGAILTMTASDLRQRVRDRSVLIFGLAVPFALMWVFNLLFAGVGSSESLEPITVGVAAGADDQVVAGFLEVVDSIDALDITVAPLDGDDVEGAVDAGDVDMGLVFPGDFAELVQAGGSPTVEAFTSGNAGLEEQVVLSVASGFLDRVATATRAATAANEAGLAGDEMMAVAQQVATSAPTVVAEVGAGSDEQLSLQGYLVAGQTALFMFFTVGFGVIGYLQERDVGTLPRLQSMPMAPSAIIIAKTLTSFVLGVVATSVLLGAGATLFDVSFGSVVPVAVLVVVAVAATTSLVLLITKVVTTAEQAQVANSIVGLVMGILGGAFFPIGGSGWLALVSDLTPPAAFIRGLGITNGGGGVADLATPLAILGGFLVVSVVLWFVLPEREVAA
jgi:ABC-2 type transport system permease protein